MIDLHLTPENITGGAVLLIAGKSIGAVFAAGYNGGGGGGSAATA